MKRLFSRYFVVLIVFVLAGTSACSSDDDNNDTPSKSAGKALAGSYIGTLSSPEVFDVTLTVTETTNGKIRVSTDKGNTTPKEIAVSWNGDDSIIGNDDQGVIIYELKTETISLATEKTAEKDVQIFFKGRRK